MTREEIADQIITTANNIKDYVPKSREAVLAVNKLEEAVHWIAADAVRIGEKESGVADIGRASDFLEGLLKIAVSRLEKVANGADAAK